MKLRSFIPFLTVTCASRLLFELKFDLKPFWNLVTAHEKFNVLVFHWKKLRRVLP
jgi:hypothetical protein